jgi:phage tail-like protein
MYPLTSLNFTVDWGDATSNFAEVSGLVTEAEVIEYRGGDDRADFVSKLPGLRKAGNVTFKRGIVPAEAGAGLFQWYDEVLNHAGPPRSVTVTLLNEDRDPAMRWTLHQALPVKLEGPGLNATGNEVAIESMELACERIEIKPGG